jgi:hypothetical protein
MKLSLQSSFLLPDLLLCIYFVFKKFLCMSLFLKVTFFWGKQSYQSERSKNAGSLFLNPRIPVHLKAFSSVSPGEHNGVCGLQSIASIKFSLVGDQEVELLIHTCLETSTTKDTATSLIILSDGI